MRRSLQVLVGAFGWKEEVAEEGVWLDRGVELGVVVGRYTLVPVCPLIKSSLSELQGEHTHTYSTRRRTRSLARFHS